MIFLQLFWEFLKTGLFAVGGGLATLPFLKAITHKYPWFTANDLMDMIAVSESTPGPMGVNSATYAGFHAAGLPGALTDQLRGQIPHGPARQHGQIRVAPGQGHDRGVHGRLEHRAHRGGPELARAGRERAHRCSP